MKPHEAADWLKELRDVVAVEPSIRKSLVTWFVVAVDNRLRDPDTHLDNLLGLRSHKGGRLTLHCKIPRRDQTLRMLASSLGIRHIPARRTKLSGVRALANWAPSPN
jgi:hypothetical protein